MVEGTLMVATIAVSILMLYKIFSINEIFYQLVFRKTNYISICKIDILTFFAIIFAVFLFSILDIRKYEFRKIDISIINRMMRKKIKKVNPVSKKEEEIKISNIFIIVGIFFMLGFIVFIDNIFSSCMLGKPFFNVQTLSFSYALFVAMKPAAILFKFVTNKDV